MRSKKTRFLEGGDWKGRKEESNGQGGSETYRL